MNRNELDPLLKSAHVPERPEEYWNNFPGETTALILRREQSGRSVASERPVTRRLYVFAWGSVLAAACVVIGFILGFGRGRDSAVHVQSLADVRKYYREIEALFPNQVRAIVFDQQGTHLALAENADVPASPALYLKICGPKGCESVITFSGQQVKFNGENYEVLADPKNRVILVGEDKVWSTGDNSAALRLETQAL